MSAPWGEHSRAACERTAAGVATKWAVSSAFGVAQDSPSLRGVGIPPVRSSTGGGSTPPVRTGGTAASRCRAELPVLGVERRGLFDESAIVDNCLGLGRHLDALLRRHRHRAAPHSRRQGQQRACKTASRRRTRSVTPARPKTRYGAIARCWPVDVGGWRQASDASAKRPPSRPSCARSQHGRRCEATDWIPSCTQLSATSRLPTRHAGVRGPSLAEPACQHRSASAFARTGVVLSGRSHGRRRCL